MMKMTKDYKCNHYDWSKKVTSSYALIKGVNTFSTCPKCK